MLVLVVGPSGAGKDTLLSALRDSLPPETRVRFARREITRPASASEDNIEITEAAFEAKQKAGGYALSWRAHGLCYGIDAGVLADVASGLTVIASISRAVLAEAAPLRPRVIEITASPAILADRLAGRGRETAEQIAERLSRQVPIPAGMDVVTILNDGTIEDAVTRLRAAICP